MIEHATLRIADDTPPQKLVLLGKYCLIRSGLVPEVVELLKAEGTMQRRTGTTPAREGLEPFPSLAMETLWQHLAAWGQAWPERLGKDVARQVFTPAGLLSKATGNGWAFPWSVDAWGLLRDTMQAIHRNVLDWLTTSEAPPLSPARFRQLGLTTVVRDAFGQATLQAMPSTGPLRRTATERAAIDYARQHAAARLRPVFSGLEARVEARLLEQERQMVQMQTAGAIEARQGARRLASVLAEQAGSWERDFTRVARTELADAHAHGAVATILSQEETSGGSAPETQVYRIPSAQACLTCLHLYLLPDGSPRLYPLRELLANGTNEGRKQAEWLPVASSTHPNCVCSPPQMYVPAVEMLFARMRARHAAAQEEAIRETLQETS